MKFLYPLISILIAAVILSSAIAKEENQSQRKFVRVPREASLIHTFDDRIRRKCERNGGPTAYEEADYNGREQRWSSCVDSIVNITEFKVDFITGVLFGEQKNVIQNYCRRIPALRNCAVNVINSIKPCLDPEERVSFDVLVQVFTLTAQFLCDNEDIFSNFIVAGGLECLGSKYPVIQTRCGNQVFTLSNYFDIVAIPVLGILPKLSLDLTGCTQIEEYSTCSVRELKKCKNEIPANIVEQVKNFIKNSTSCAILLDQQTTGN